MIACFLNNISAKYYENRTMLSRVIAKNIGNVFFETQCRTIWWQYTHQQPAFQFHILSERTGELNYIYWRNTDEILFLFNCAQKGQQRDSWFIARSGLCNSVNHLGHSKTSVVDDDDDADDDDTSMFSMREISAICYLKNRWLFFLPSLEPYASRTTCLYRTLCHKYAIFPERQ